MWILPEKQIYLHNTNVLYVLPLFYSPTCSVTWELQSFMKWLNVPQFIFLLYRSHITCVQKVTDTVCLQMPTKYVNNELTTFLLLLSHLFFFFFFSEVQAQCLAGIVVFSIKHLRNTKTHNCIVTKHHHLLRCILLSIL